MPTVKTWLSELKAQDWFFMVKAAITSIGNVAHYSGV